MNYKEANDLFEKKTKIEENKINLETSMTLEKVNKSFVVNLYSTPIITILPNGLFRLFANGKLTNLTKSRMEKYSPVKLKQVNGWWFVVDKKEKVLSLYYERVIIDTRGKPTIKISEKSIIFKRLVLLLNKMIDELCDSRICSILAGHCSQNETGNLTRLLESSSKDIKSIYSYNSSFDLRIRMDQLISNMLKFGGITNSNTYLNMKTSVFKSLENLLRAYFIPYALNQLKYILKTKKRETVCAVAG